MHCPRCDRKVELPPPGGIFYCPKGYEFMMCFTVEHYFELTRKTMTDRDPLFQEREKTHGSFKTNAEISQKLKDIFHRLPFEGGDVTAFNIHMEALDMIALKLSRILSGQANFKDHWADIAGYAKLAEEACE